MRKRKTTDRARSQGRKRDVATLQPLKRGDRVEVIDTPLSLVTKGDQGTVDKEHEGGYWVQITKYYPHAQIGIKGSVETRTSWFKRKELRKLQDKVATLQS